MAFPSINIVPHMLSLSSRTIQCCTVSRFNHYHSSSSLFSLGSCINRCPVMCSLANSSSVEAQNKADDIYSLSSVAFVPGDSWPEFAQNVSGEWDGYGADFNNEGKPIELPESVVPEAFREWEVKVYDWQTQCPTLAESGDHVLGYKVIKLLPTVGCEADAATRYSIDERHIGGVNNEVSAFAYQSSGCYVAVWPVEHKDLHKKLEVEHCLVNPTDRESRVRIIQLLRVDDNSMSLQSVRVFCEQWYGPFRNGDQLGGCAIRDSAFASTEATKPSDVVGPWQGSHAIANFTSSEMTSFQELTGEHTRKSTRDEVNLTLLPKNLWCSIKERGDGTTCCEVGWLFEQGQAITSMCTFTDIANLKEISISREAIIQ